MNIKVGKYDYEASYEKGYSRALKKGYSGSMAEAYAKGYAEGVLEGKIDSFISIRSCLKLDAISVETARRILGFSEDEFFFFEEILGYIENVNMQ